MSGNYTNDAKELQQFDVRLLCKRHGVSESDLQAAINMYLHCRDEPSIAERHRHLGEVQAVLTQAIELCDGLYDIDPLLEIQAQNYARQRALPPVRKGRPYIPGRQAFLRNLIRVYPNNATMGKGHGPESPFFRFVRDVFNVIEPQARDYAIKNDFFRVIKRLKSD